MLHQDTSSTWNLLGQVVAACLELLGLVVLAHGKLAAIVAHIILEP